MVLLLNCSPARPALRGYNCFQCLFFGRSSPRMVSLHLLSVIQNRHVTEYREPSEKRLDKLRAKDQIPFNFNLIYRAPMETLVKIAYPSTLALNLIAPLLASVYRYYSIGNFTDFQRMETIKDLTYPQFEVYAFLGISMLMFLGISSFVMKYPFRIYKQDGSKEHAAVFVGVIPFTSRRVYFSDAKKHTFPNPLYRYFNRMHYYLGPKKALLLDMYFRRPSDINNMLK